MVSKRIFLFLFSIFFVILLDISLFINGDKQSFGWVGEVFVSLWRKIPKSDFITQVNQAEKKAPPLTKPDLVDTESKYDVQSFYESALNEIGKKWDKVYSQKNGSVLALSDNLQPIIQLINRNISSSQNLHVKGWNCQFSNISNSRVYCLSKYYYYELNFSSFQPVDMNRFHKGDSIRFEGQLKNPPFVEPPIIWEWSSNKPTIRIEIASILKDK
jgi:hypothetical protein